MSDINDKCLPSSTTLPEREKAENSPFNIKGLEGKNDKARVVRTDVINTNTPSPRRKRTERAARKIIKSSVIPAGRRPVAYRQIRNAKQPVVEAKRIVNQQSVDRHKLDIVQDQEIDLSDVQELRVKLIRRDMGIWPPHTDYLNRIEIDILTRGMTSDEFKRRSAIALNMEQPIDKKKRYAEWKFARLVEWD